MVKESFLIGLMMKGGGQLCVLWRGSLFYYFLKMIASSLSMQTEQSSILNFLKSNWDSRLCTKRSYSFAFVVAICNAIGSKIRFQLGGFSQNVRESVLLSFLNENFIVLMVYGAFFAIPFLPTMLLAALCIGTFFVYLLNVFTGRMKLHMPGILGVVITLFAVCYAFSTFTSYNFPKSVQVFLIFISYLLMFFVVERTISTERKFNVLMNLFLISGAIVALYALFQYVTGVEMDAAWVDAESFENIKTRAYATFTNPNVLGEYMIILTSLAVGMLWKAKSLWTKLWYILLAGMLMLGLVATNSRGAMLGLLLSAGFFVLLAEKRLIPLGIICLLLLPFLLPPALWERLASAATMNDSSSLYRISIYKASFNILNHYWLTGIGVDAFTSIYPLFSFEAAVAYHSHNLFLQEFIELGIVGFSLFAATILLFFQRLYYGIRHSSAGFRFMIASIFGGFAGILLQGMVDHLWFDYSIVLLFWAVMGLGVAAVRIGVKLKYHEK